MIDRKIMYLIYSFLNLCQKYVYNSKNVDFKIYFIFKITFSSFRCDSSVFVIRPKLNGLYSCLHFKLLTRRPPFTPQGIRSYIFEIFVFKEAKNNASVMLSSLDLCFEQSGSTLPHSPAPMCIANQI
jgi:hypothetical protein